MATDASVRYGLQISRFSDDTKNRLRDGLPKEASVNNPIDLIGDAQADRYELALGSLSDDNVDCGLVLLTPQAMVDLKKDDPRLIAWAWRCNPCGWGFGVQRRSELLLSRIRSSSSCGYVGIQALDR